MLESKLVVAVANVITEMLRLKKPKEVPPASAPVGSKRLDLVDQALDVHGESILTLAETVHGLHDVVMILARHLAGEITDKEARAEVRATLRQLERK